MLDARRPDDQSGASFPAPLLESMTSPDLAIAEPEVCPYLGLPDDPRTRFTFADPAHRCHVGAKPIPIDLGHQGAYCLTTGYPACKRFRSPRKTGGPASGPARSLGATIAAGAAAGTAPGAVVPVTIAAAHATVSRDGGTSKGRSRALRRAAALLAVLALVMLAGAIRAGVIGRSPAGGGVHEVVASPSAAATPAPTTASAGTPTPAPTPSPSSSATSAPTGTPRSVSIIHVVVRGETLSSIAARFGVTAKAIQDANKIADPSLILVGDRLVIPPPP